MNLNLSEARLKELNFDSGTGLFTLTGILPKLNQRRTMSNSSMLGILFLDLTLVRRLEENYGWQIYDNFLRTLAEVLINFNTKHDFLNCEICVNNRCSDQFLFFFSSNGAKILGKVRS